MVLYTARLILLGCVIMKKEVNFTPIDLKKWHRGQVFYYFCKIAPTGYSITVDLDVTKMRMCLKAANLKFFPAYVWLVTKTLNLQQEFKIAEKDGKIGYYDTLSPLYASFHNDDKTFSLMWTEYDDNFMEFYNSYINNKTLYGDNHGTWHRLTKYRRLTHIRYLACLGFHLIILLFTLMKTNHISFRLLRQENSMRRMVKL